VRNAIAAKMILILSTS